MSRCLSVVIPVYNERATFEELLRRVLDLPLRKEVLLVDDGSTDGTRQRLQALEQEAGRKALASEHLEGLRVFYHDQNQGKGACIRTAIPHCRGEITVIQDADLEYDPADYPKLLEPLLSGDADVVYGSRFLSGPHRVLYFWHRVGNGLLTLLSNLCTDLNLSDMETGSKAFRTEVLRRVPIRSNRFGFEPEVTAKVARLRCRIYEVPISYRGRTYAEGKKAAWSDGLAALWTILKYRFVSDLGEDGAARR